MFCRRPSICDILSSLLLCLSPSKGVLTHVLTISLARSLPTILRQDEDICIVMESAHLCCEELVAERGSHPGNLFATIDIPIPVPQISIPFSIFPAETASETFSPKSG